MNKPAQKPYQDSQNKRIPKALTFHYKHYFAPMN